MKGLGGTLRDVGDDVGDGDDVGTTLGTGRRWGRTTLATLGTATLGATLGTATLGTALTSYTSLYVNNLRMIEVRG